jgi:hypothetical protein
MCSACDVLDNKEDCEDSVGSCHWCKDGSCTESPCPTGKGDVVAIAAGVGAGGGALLLIALLGYVIWLLRKNNGRRGDDMEELPEITLSVPFSSD